jgi:hypothetical protein
MSLGSDIVVPVVLIRVQHVFNHLIQADIVIADGNLRFVRHSEAAVPKSPRNALHVQLLQPHTRLSQYKHISNTPQPHSKIHRQLKHISI